MKKIIEETLEHFSNANLASETARQKIASEIIKRFAHELIKTENSHRPSNGTDEARPAGTLPSSTGRNFIKLDSEGC